MLRNVDNVRRSRRLRELGIGDLDLARRRAGFRADAARMIGVR